MSQLSINPFDDLIVKEPRRREPAVAGLNEEPLQALLREFEYLAEGSAPRPIRRVAQAQLVTSAQPGFGKSHLIGRLFRELHGRATLVYVHPFQNAATVFQSLMLAVTREMHFPDRVDSGAWDRGEATQMDHFAHGVLAHLLADLVESGRDVQTEENLREQIVARLRADPMAAFNRGADQPESNWAGWMREQFPKLIPLFEEALATRGLALAAPRGWLEVLFAYAFSPFDTVLRRTCLDWMVANPLEDDDLKRLGLRLRDGVSAELDPAEANQICRFRLADLCQLAVFFRPFLLCFDQTEVYGHHAPLARAFGLVIGRLVDEAVNHLTLVTSNQFPWTERIALNFEDADRHRLLEVALTLTGMDRRQAEELARLRMAAVGTDSKKTADFLAGDWISTIFQASGRIGARFFLQKCKEQWDHTPEAKPLPLSELYRQHREKLLAAPKRHQFEPDTLQWLVETAAAGLEGIAVASLEEKYFRVWWETPQRICYFGFVGGAHWKQWRAVAQAAVAKCGGHARPAKTIFFRTPEQRPIPSPGWVFAGEIEAAKSRYLQIIVLSIEELADLYAARELFADAAQGDIAYSAEEVLKFLRTRLAPWWDRFSGPIHEGGDPAPAPGHPPEAEAAASGAALALRVREIVERARFLSVDEVIAQLPEKPTPEEVLTACGFSGEIRIHTHPSMTVLQWQAA